MQVTGKPGYRAAALRLHKLMQLRYAARPPLLAAADEIEAAAMGVQEQASSALLHRAQADGQREGGAAAAGGVHGAEDVGMAVQRRGWRDYRAGERQGW